MIAYPPELPITARRAEIVEAVRRNQVVIISGETGCGKSTQIPKMCLEAGRGRRGRIGCTQPRRIAAVTIAARIAEERGEPVGGTVGYKIRFDDRTSRDTRIKILTDGMLLAETQSDPRLLEYDTLIIDEAHERSLNIDFLLGIIKTLLPVRPDLKLIVTSATLDIEKFLRAFEEAPLIEVSGRVYPVEIEYRPPDERGGDAEDADYVDLAAEVVDDLKTEYPAGDILVFMPTEQDILETCEILEGRRYPGVTVLPLYARLPGAQQGRVYSVQGPKIVVATNVAETSLTIPGIKYVVDSGLARISQYFPGARIQSLPIRPVSQSSADQRKGRCGRVQKGLCVRLYSEEDYVSRPPFTAPEILRSNLAEVILRMIDLRLGHPLKFPFVDRPNPKNVEDGYETLVELGAIRRDGGEEPQLTEKGRLMARMPLDPRIARMLLEARPENCLRETAVIASALSIRDPRERPPEKAAQADAMHAPFRDPDSDFLTLLNIWDRYHGDFEGLQGLNRKRKFCRDHFLSFSRMREWTLVHAEVLDILRELKIPAGRSAAAGVPGFARGSTSAAGARPLAPAERTKELYAAVHRSIASGYLSNIAVHKDRNMFTAAKGREAMVFPGSTLFGKNATWIVAAEMVRTSRLFARVAARIEGGWLEELGGELCRSTYTNPRWDKDRGQVVADESVALFGLEIVAARIVPYGRVDPEAAARIFVRSALVEGRVKEPLDFLRLNLSLQVRLRTMEEKLRRHDVLTDLKTLDAFYSERLPGIFDLRGLKERLKKRGGDEFLRMSEADAVRVFPDPAELSLYPDEIAAGSRAYPAVYKFTPGEEDDGVTLIVPMDEVPRLSADFLEWGVPGHLREKLAALVQGLPKRYRKLFVPVADAVGTILTDIRPSDGPLFETLSRVAKRRFRAEVPVDAWAEVDLPRHLRLRVALVDPQGKELTSGRDLDVLRRIRKEAAFTAAKDPVVWERARRQWERTGLTAWDFGTVPEVVSIGPGAAAYPGLEPAESGANFRLFASPEEALDSHKRGVESLLLLKFAKDFRFMEQRLVLPAEYQKTALSFGGAVAVEKMLAGSLRADVFRKDIRSPEEFKSYTETVVRLLFERAHALWEAARAVLDAQARVRADLAAIGKAKPANKALAVILAEIREDVERLVPKDFLAVYPIARLGALARYLEACRLRADRAQHGPDKDRKKAEQAAVFVKALDRRLAGLGPGTAAGVPVFARGSTSAALARGDKPPAGGESEARLSTPPEIRQAVEEFRWMVEEFKVSLFAPELKTAFPISPKRLAEKLKEIESLGEDLPAKLRGGSASIR